MSKGHHIRFVERAGVRVVAGAIVALSSTSLLVNQAAAQAKPPIKIGFIAPTSGGFAPSGEECILGAKL